MSCESCGQYPEGWALLRREAWKKDTLKAPDRFSLGVCRKCDQAREIFKNYEVPGEYLCKSCYAKLLDMEK